MGLNTVMLVLNDAIGVGAEDPQLGERIERAILGHGRNDGHMFSSNGRCSSSYGQVISSSHADYYQVTVVHGNMGWRVDDAAMDKYLGWHALDQMKECLERNGYKVTKRRQGSPASKATPVNVDAVPRLNNQTDQPA